MRSVDVWRFLRVECMPLSLFTRLYAVVLLRLRVQRYSMYVFSLFCLYLLLVFSLARSLVSRAATTDPIVNPHTHTQMNEQWHNFFSTFFRQILFIILTWLGLTCVCLCSLCCCCCCLLLAGCYSFAEFIKFWLTGWLVRWLANDLQIINTLHNKPKKTVFFLRSLGGQIHLYLLLLFVFVNVCVLFYMNGSHFSCTHEKNSAFLKLISTRWLCSRIVAFLFKSSWTFNCSRKEIIFFSLVRLLFLSIFLVN